MSDREPQMLVVGPRNTGGRPRSADPTVPVMVRIPSDKYDRLIKMASRRDESVSSIVRQILLAQSFLK